MLDLADLPATPKLFPSSQCGRSRELLESSSQTDMSSKGRASISQDIRNVSEDKGHEKRGKCGDWASYQLVQDANGHYPIACIHLRRVVNTVTSAML